jgi:hypothetical protein
VRRAIAWTAGPLCVLAALLVAWWFELSFENVLVLAPVIVLSVAAIVGLLLLWTRAFWESVLRRRGD